MTNCRLVCASTTAPVPGITLVGGQSCLGCWTAPAGVLPPAGPSRSPRGCRLVGKGGPGEVLQGAVAGELAGQRVAALRADQQVRVPRAVTADDVTLRTLLHLHGGVTGCMASV